MQAGAFWEETWGGRLDDVDWYRKVDIIIIYNVSCDILSIDVNSYIPLSYIDLYYCNWNILAIDIFANRRYRC